MPVQETVARKSLLGLHLSRVSEQVLVVVLSGGLMVIIAMSLPGYPQLTQFRAEALQAMPNVLAPLIILALFIERGVEVVLAGWRVGGAIRRESTLNRALEKGTAAAQWEAKVELDSYNVHTQRLAFLVAFVLSLLISMMGVRAIEMLVAENLVPDAPGAQRNLFVRVDIVITALLLTGGAEGIHKVVNAFTTFIDMTKERVKDPEGMRRAGAPPAGKAAGKAAPDATAGAATGAATTLATEGAAEG